jgi:hypothetical protein
MGDSENGSGTTAAIATASNVDFALRHLVIHNHGHTPTRQSAESGTSRDESGMTRDQSADRWDESAARATGMMLPQVASLPARRSITET